MPGKYSGQRNILQRRSLESLDHGHKILLIKAELAEMSKDDIGGSIAALKNEKNKIKDREKEVNITLTALESLLVEHLECSGEESFKRTKGGSFTIQDKLYPFVKDKEAYRKWLIKNGYESQMTVHPKVTDSIVGERVLANLPLPDGVEAYIQVGIGVRGVLEK